MEEKSRIEQLIEYLKLNSGQFATEIDITPPALSHILNGRNNPSLDVMKKILDRYPFISSDWLILGKGNMLREKSNSQAPSLFDDLEINDKKSNSYIDDKQMESAPKTSLKENKSDDQTNETSVNDVQTIQETKIVTSKKIERIIVYFEDKTFQEFKNVE